MVKDTKAIQAKTRAAKSKQNGSGTARKTKTPAWPAAMLALGIALMMLAAVVVIWRPATSERGTNLVEYTLEVKEMKMSLGSESWDVWTYNGMVPGPTLTAVVGDVLSVKLVNKGSKIHSFHTHFTSYAFENDGSQANVIGGKGAGGMVPPGGEFTYRFNMTEPGIFYYHCHSADGAMISMHIRMGLYGAIVVSDPNAPKYRDEVIFYSEAPPGAPAPYVINNRGIPGGEHTLEEIFLKEGFDGVVKQLNVTVTFFKFRVGETARIHVINIGDQVHSHHGHGHSHRSRTLDGKPWPANVLPLVPGQADTLEITFSAAGLWLFHCHVVFHADAGMIGLFIVE